MFIMEGYDCGVYACMFADRLSKDGLTSCSPEDATRNRERLVLSLIEKRGPLLEYHGDEVQPEQETAIKGVGQQNRCHVLGSKGNKKDELDGLSSCPQDKDKTINRERLVLPSLVKRYPKLECPCDGEAVQCAGGAGQQNKRHVLDPKKCDEKDESNDSNVKVKAGDESKVKAETVDDVVEVESVMAESIMVETQEKGGACKKDWPNTKVKAGEESEVKAKTVDDVVEVESVKTQDKGGTRKKDWPNAKMPALKAELRVRNLKLGGRKADLVSRLIASDLEMDKSEKRIDGKPTSSRLTSDELLELQKQQEHLHEIDECVLNLKEYRGHLARHVSEDTYAQSKIDNLADDEAIVTSDYKMKILSCFYRETQKKWFGKRGTNLLGFMITTNSLDEADKLQGVKDVQFIFMVTDDSLTDAWEVACAKATVYEEFLPDHVEKVRFWSDGAGCFKSKTHRVFQPFWKHWVGVEEIELRITPAGNGKSQLDGSFGRLNFVLHGAVDEGHSYYDAPSILNAISHSTGLAATKVRAFLPDRSSQVKGDIEGMRFESVLLTLLDPNRDEKDHSVQVFHHSGYGQGQKLDLSMQSLLFYEDPDEADEKLSKKEKKEKKKAAMIEVYNTDVSRTLPERQGAPVCFLSYPFFLALSQGSINLQKLSEMKPSSLSLEEARNVREGKKSSLHKPGTGASHPKVRNRKRGNQIKARVGRNKDVEAKQRTEMERRGLFLCHECCQRTGRFCRGVFLYGSGLKRHQDAHKHNFPGGVNARDWVRLQASKPGGVLAAGGRPDRQSKSLLFLALEAAPLGSRGELIARCKGQFNRKETNGGYKKPPRLLEVLRELYALEPKLRAQEMRDIMKKMRDDDGGLLFCYSKRFTTGLVLSIDQIQSWITSETQKKKANQKDSKSEKEKEEKFIQELKMGNKSMETDP
jgi:hypothetical protein